MSLGLESDSLFKEMLNPSWNMLTVDDGFMHRRNLLHVACRKSRESGGLFPPRHKNEVIGSALLNVFDLRRTHPDSLRRHIGAIWGVTIRNLPAFSFHSILKILLRESGISVS